LKLLPEMGFARAVLLIAVANVLKLLVGRAEGMELGDLYE
jgi:hypothetical protein